MNESLNPLGTLETIFNEPTVRKAGQQSVKIDYQREALTEQLLDQLVPPKGLIVKRSQLNGYGVFAASSFQTGEILEEAPFVRTDIRSKDLVHLQIRQTCYPLPCSCEECQHRGRFFVIAAGFVQMYNHSEDPHVSFDFNRVQRVIRVVALKNIAAGQEIFASYGLTYEHFAQVEI